MPLLFIKKLIITEQEETKFYVMFHELNSPTFENIQLILEYYIVNHSAICCMGKVYLDRINL